MIYLTLDDLVHIARRALVIEVQVRDYGLLQSAVARPQTTVFGADAYSTIEEKAAALIHSIVRNHALVDGNKRLALAAGLVFLGINGFRLTMTNDEAYDFIISIAAGEVDEISVIAEQLSRSTTAD